MVGMGFMFLLDSLIELIIQGICTFLKCFSSFQVYFNIVLLIIFLSEWIGYLSGVRRTDNADDTDKNGFLLMNTDKNLS